MTYKFSLYGRGAEVTFSEVSDKVLDYIKDNFDGDNNEFIDAWGNGEIPNGELGLPEDIADMYDYDDYGHDHGCYSNWFKLIITDEDGKEVGSFDEGSHLLMCDTDDNISKDHDHYIVWTSEEKGTFLEGELDIDGAFDPEKIVINVTTYRYNNGNNIIPIINSIEYDGCDLDGEFMESTGKGMDVTIY